MLKGSLRAIWAGAVWTGLQLAYIVVCLIGLPFSSYGGICDDFQRRLIVFAMLTVLAAVEWLLCSMSLGVHYRLLRQPAE